MSKTLYPVSVGDDGAIVDAKGKTVAAVRVVDSDVDVDELTAAVIAHINALRPPSARCAVCGEPAQPSAVGVPVCVRDQQRLGRLLAVERLDPRALPGRWKLADDGTIVGLLKWSPNEAATYVCCVLALFDASGSPL